MKRQIPTILLIYFKNSSILKIITLILLIVNNLSAAGKFDFSPLARQAYQKTLAMKFDEADLLLERLKKEEPENLIVFFIENHKECLTVFVSEEEALYNQFEPYKERRLTAIKRGDASSPYYLFTQAQIRLFWAMNKAKFGKSKYISALNEASTAYELLEQNQKKFPDFLPNKMSLGILHAVVGSIPDNYKWGFKLISGMEGTVQQGQAEIEEVIRYAKTNDFIFEQEALVMYAFLMMHLGNQNESAWTIINNGKLKPHESQLACFALATVAMRTGRNDKAIEILANRPNSVGYYPMYYLDYLTGICKLYRNDNDADIYLKKYVYNFKGRNYIKEAYQKLGWHEWLKNDWKTYHNYLEIVKTKGRTDVGGDRNAQKEAETMATPDQTLLRGRLYFDGGYYQKAYDFLKNKKESDFSQQAFQLEYTYRMGRILQMLKRTNEAIQYYDKTIQQGKNSPYYYACNAALQMGSIYEDYKNYGKAREYYSFCLKLNPNDHADALHAKAKAGLSRMKNLN